jgi:predicted small secreted protein
MRNFLTVSILVILCNGCGTLGGMISGAGSDIQKAGEWIRKK